MSYDDYYSQKNKEVKGEPVKLLILITQQGEYPTKVEVPAASRTDALHDAVKILESIIDLSKSDKGASR